MMAQGMVTSIGMMGAALGLGLPLRAGMAPENLRCEYTVNPLGIDVAKPRLSWVLASAERGAAQTAYKVLVASSEAKLAAGEGDLWDSGIVKSDDSIQIVYGGKELASRQRCWWAVRVWDQADKQTQSAPATWEIGLLKPADWKARWISAEPASPTVRYLRKGYKLGGKIKQARLYATALGVYEISINGKRVGDYIFAPGWTDYHKRIPYQTYDVTALVKEGDNAIGAVLGDGWYCGFVGLGGRDRYGKLPLLCCQLEVQYADGKTDVIVTDESWKTSGGPILTSDMLMGEVYDARRVMAGWSQGGFDDAAWKAVVVRDVATPLVAQCGPPVRRLQELKTRSITGPGKATTQPAKYVFDLGQNMVGWARLKAKGPAGTVVTLRFAEMLNPDGTIYTANYRGAKCIDTYTLRGGGEEVYEPTFTFRGFRYVEVSGYPGVPGPEAITGIVVYSDTPAVGSFECSNAMVNQLYSNIVWGQRGNFLEVPTDCPQRDERLGWTGDAQVFVRTATCNGDVASFFTKWLVDLDDAQAPDGAFPDVAPRVAAGAGTAAWGDAGTICPWTIYQVYGDTRIIERHFASMTKWIEYMRTHSRDLIRPDAGYGDWLSIAANTPKDVIGTAYFAHSTDLVARMAAIIGKQEEARKYEDLFGQIKAAFNKAFVDADGKIKGDTQTCYVMALRFNLLPEDKRPAAAKRLVEDIEKKNTHLSTGFVGVRDLLPVLTDMGNVDVAYRLLLNDTFPSWGYSIKQGATTIWERWDGWTKEKGFQDKGMNSFNHYSLGSVGQWMFATVGGIELDPARPAFKHIILRPRPGGGLSFAKCHYQSINGPISCEWKVETGVLTLDISVPANTTATLYVPNPTNAVVSEGGKPVDQSPGVKAAGREGDVNVYEVQSGQYRFAAAMP